MASELTRCARKDLPALHIAFLLSPAATVAYRDKTPPNHAGRVQVCQKVSLTHLEVRQANCASIEGLVEAHNGTPAGQLIKDFLSLSAKVRPSTRHPFGTSLCMLRLSTCV